jgi:hypothetical protein
MKIARNEYALHLLKPDPGASHLPKPDLGKDENRIMSFFIHR